MKLGIERLNLLLVPLASLALAAGTAQDRKAHDYGWTHSGVEGPEHWGYLKPECASCLSSHRQSPIDIRDAHDADLPPIHFDYKPSVLKVIDNGHTIQVNYDRNR